MPRAFGRLGAPRSPARYSPARSRPCRRSGAWRSTPACQVVHAARVLRLVPGAFTRFPRTRPSCQGGHPSPCRCSGHGPAGWGAGSLSLAGGPRRRRRRGRRGRRPVSRRTSSPGPGTAGCPPVLALGPLVAGPPIPLSASVLARGSSLSSRPGVRSCETGQPSHLSAGTEDAGQAEAAVGTAGSSHCL